MNTTCIYFVVYVHSIFRLLTPSGCRPTILVQVFEGTSPPGHIKIDSVIKALTTYGSEKLTEEQAHDLVSQVRKSSAWGHSMTGTRLESALLRRRRPYMIVLIL